MLANEAVIVASLAIKKLVMIIILFAKGATFIPLIDRELLQGGFR
jgi:hypothetical protein